LFELKLWSEDGGIGLNKCVSLVADDGFRKRRTFQFREVGFWVKELELRRRAGHEEVNDGFGFGPGMRGPWLQGAACQVIGKERGRGNLSEANATFTQEVAS
jgi:hypothetical protein